MFYGNMPMMIFILASGYLFIVYLLLGLAKRSGHKPSVKNSREVMTINQEQELSVTPSVTEVVNTQ